MDVFLNFNKSFTSLLTKDIFCVILFCLFGGGVVVMDHQFGSMVES